MSEIFASKKWMECIMAVRARVRGRHVKKGLAFRN